MEQLRATISYSLQTSKNLEDLIRYYKQSRSAVIARIIDEKHQQFCINRGEKKHD